MTEADQVRSEIESALDGLAESVLLVQRLEEQIDGVTGTVLLVGFTNSNIARSVGLSQLAKQEAEQILTHLFELRQRLTLFRDKL